MAKLAEENVLDYRRGGDTVDDFAQKYMAEITRIYQFLNNLRSHNTAGPEQIEPDSYQIIVEDNKLKIRNEANTEWITLMKVEQNGGFTSETFGKLTSGDGSSMPTTGVNTYDTYWDTAHGKMYMWLNGSWQLLLSLDLTDLTGYDTLITANDVVSTETVTHTPNKLVRTNANGVLPVDVLGNAGMIAGIRNEVNNLTDGQVLTYRAASNSWRNEPKGVVGAGASLIINDGETQLAEYSGDEQKIVDIGTTAVATELSTHKASTMAHADLLHLRKPETAYAVGDIAYSALLPSWAYLECTVGGTTGSGNLPVPSSVSEFSTFTDGTVTWKIQRVSGKLPLSGGTMTGKIATNQRISMTQASNDDAILIVGGNAYLNGAHVALFGNNRSDAGADRKGSFALGAVDTSQNLIELIGKSNKSLTWDGVEVKQLSFPSDTQINIHDYFTWTNPVTTPCDLWRASNYTVPSNGYFMVMAHVKASVQWGAVFISSSNGIRQSDTTFVANVNIAATIPVRKGQVIGCDLTNADSNTMLFIPCVGEVM